MEQHCPKVLTAVRTCLSQSQSLEGREYAQVELDALSFGDAPDESIDYALMEKSANVAVVPCSIGWSDIGSWKALGDLTLPDGNGNRVEGEVVLHDVKDCYIRGEDRIVGAVGVHNLIIIDTPDALLVADRDHAQDVKFMYTTLKDKGHDAYKLHRTVYRPWGTYTVLEEGYRFKIKRIVVKPGASLSLQMHYHRSEHWIVVSGMAKVMNGNHEILIRSNESTYIPAGHKHRLENPGVVDVVLIEVQSGEYLGEDDIVRFDDQYGRSPQ
jgi:mannose-1-phosphate guanylyltransferase